MVGEVADSQERPDARGELEAVDGLRQEVVRAGQDRSLDVSEVFESSGRGPARSFPAMLPVLHLDRIYVRGFRIKLAHVHRGLHWSRISDHAALSALLTRE